MTSEERHSPGITREYTGDGIVVHWEPKLCIHTANCLRALPSVFDAQARPWVRVTAADADAIADAIERCPTGALWYERTDGKPQEAAPEPAVIDPRPNGPLLVRGKVQIVDRAGNVVREGTRLALCRCGHSGNKPYCDLSHRRVGFRSDEP